MNIHFEKAGPQHQAIIFAWLETPHMKEFWDNSQEHKDDILNFIQGRIQPSHYFNGIITYWIGAIENEPYCFILTSEVLADNTKGIWKQHLSKTGKTYGIDFGIGNEKYLGQGLAAPTLQSFTEFFQSQVDRAADTFYIDPDENNPRAKHVYEKAGFQLVGDFTMERGVFSGKKTYLMVKKIPSSSLE